jgi:hypothetical protein
VVSSWSVETEENGILRAEKKKAPKVVLKLKRHKLILRKVMQRREIYHMEHSNKTLIHERSHRRLVFISLPILYVDMSRLF